MLHELLSPPVFMQDFSYFYSEKILKYLDPKILEQCVQGCILLL